MISPTSARWKPQAALALLTILAFLPALGAGFIWDDDRYIENNIQLRSFDGLTEIWTNFQSEPQWYPLTHTSFWIEYQLWGQHPLGYHIDNILLHVVSVILLMGILTKLEIRSAWLIAAIWAIHPLQVESVAWATERKNVLSGLFFLLSIRAYLQFDSLRDRHYIVALVLFVCALLSKSVTSSMPAVILVLIWWKRGKITRRDVTPLIPFFILAAAMGLLTSSMERNVVGAVGPDFNFTFIQRTMIAGRAIWFYTTSLIFPANLMFIYPRWNLDHPILIAFPISILLIVTALWLLRRRTGRGPLTAALLFIGLLFPALGFVNVFPMRYSFVANHFQYLAGIPLIALIVSILPRGKFLVLILIPLAILTWRQCLIYENRGTLWLDTINKNPTSYVAHSNYADFLLREKHDEPAAEKEYLAAVKCNSEDRASLTSLGMINHNRKDYAQAIYYFNRAIKAVSDSLPPQFLKIRGQPYFDLGNTYYRLQDYKKAEECYRKALDYQPDNKAAMENLQMAIARQGQ